MTEVPGPPNGADITSKAALHAVWRSVGRWIIFPVAGLACFVGSYALFREIVAGSAYERGLRDGEKAPVDCSAMEYQETMSGAELAWTLCGVDPKTTGGPGWYVCSFRVVARDTQPYSREHHDAPKILVPSFTVLSKAITGRWYTPGSGGKITYVDK